MSIIKAKDPSYDLWYTSPAAEWNTALPVGNGRMGAMVFGEPANELLQLNEDSIWSGNFRNRNNPKAYDNLEKIRRLINEEKTTEAEQLCADAFYGTNENQRHYQPLGDLHSAAAGPAFCFFPCDFQKPGKTAPAPHLKVPESHRHRRSASPWPSPAFSFPHK